MAATRAGAREQGLLKAFLLFLTLQQIIVPDLPDKALSRQLPFRSEKDGTYF
jgi:hypothetical protein